ncbi:MAG: efflux RND transporter periplasmic adaptor subunit, partial [Gammaproteobacteria bacterium]|nr:efflux RND transporter periplasmic adaptor subunit [Gammaproteobacteria bacterium]
MKKWLFLLILIVVVGAGLWGYFHFRQPVQALPTVAVTKGTIVEQAQAVGYIKPQHSNTIKSQVDGIVGKIFHYEGEFVKKGTPLIEISPTPSPEEYASAYQALNDATSRTNNAKNDLDRYERALKLGLISKDYTDYIAAKRTYQTDRFSQILAAQKLALLEKGKTTVAGKAIANIVTSPIDGFILNRLVDVGDSVISISSAQSSTALFTMANMSDLKFEGTVDEIDASKIKDGMAATITVGALSDQKITGVLTRISLQSDKENQAQGAGTVDSDSPFNIGFKVEVTQLKAPTNILLRSGYSATANINI